METGASNIDFKNNKVDIKAPFTTIDQRQHITISSSLKTNVDAESNSDINREDELFRSDAHSRLKLKRLNKMRSKLDDQNSNNRFLQELKEQQNEFLDKQGSIIRYLENSITDSISSITKKFDEDTSNIYDLFFEDFKYMKFLNEELKGQNRTIMSHISKLTDENALLNIKISNMEEKLDSLIKQDQERPSQNIQ